MIPAYYAVRGETAWLILIVTFWKRENSKLDKVYCQEICTVSRMLSTLLSKWR
jgi:hypothetical protein